MFFLFFPETNNTKYFKIIVKQYKKTINHKNEKRREKNSKEKKLGGKIKIKKTKKKQEPTKDDIFAQPMCRHGFVLSPCFNIIMKLAFNDLNANSSIFLPKCLISETRQHFCNFNFIYLQCREKKFLPRFTRSPFLSYFVEFNL